MVKKIAIKLSVISVAAIIIFNYFVQFLICKNMDKRSTFDSNISSALTNTFIHPLRIYDHISLWKTAAIYTIFLTAPVFIYFIVRKKKPKTEKLEDEHFMTEKELKEYNKNFVPPIGSNKTDGRYVTVYAEDIKLDLMERETGLNLNAIVFGAPGKGKTFNLVAPNLLLANSNYIITDPSGELYNDYGKYLENKGYEVLLFNIVHPDVSCRYNPYKYAKSEDDIIKLIDIFIKNAKTKGSSGDEFWENSEKMLLYAISLYVYNMYDEKDVGFNAVLDLIEEEKIRDSEELSNLQAKFAELEKLYPKTLAVRYYNDFRVAEDKTLKSILISVAVRVAKIKTIGMSYLIGDDTLDLEDFPNSKKALFIRMPTGDSSYNFVVSMLYTQAFDLFYRYGEDRVRFGYKVGYDEHQPIKTFPAASKTDSKRAYEEAQKYLNDISSRLTIKYDKKYHKYDIYNKAGVLITWAGSKSSAEAECKRLKTMKIYGCDSRYLPTHIRMFLDEFANIGEIPEFDTTLGTIRKYNISAVIILQSKNQLNKLYKDGIDEVVLGHCTVKIFLGSTDTATAKWVCELCGKKEIFSRGESYQGKGNENDSYTPHTKDLMTVSKFLRMKKEKCLILISEQYPYIGNKIKTAEWPQFNKAMKVKDLLVPPQNDYDPYANMKIKDRPDYKERMNNEINKANMINRMTEDALRKPDPKQYENIKKIKGSRNIKNAEAAANGLNDFDNGISEKEIDQDVIDNIFNNINNKDSDTSIKDIIESVFIEETVIADINNKKTLKLA